MIVYQYISVYLYIMYMSHDSISYMILISIISLYMSICISLYLDSGQLFKTILCTLPRGDT